MAKEAREDDGEKISKKVEPIMDQATNDSLPTTSSTEHDPLTVLATAGEIEVARSLQNTPAKRDGQALLPAAASPSRSYASDALVSTVSKMRKQEITQLKEGAYIAGPSNCKCKNSQCLKQYCDCFKVGRYCNETCMCLNCKNSEDFQEERQRVIDTILEKNPNAFQRKSVSTELTAAGNENGETNIVVFKGCNCKKSHCLKNYCECFERGGICSNVCKCLNCQNFEGSAERENRLESIYAAVHDATRSNSQLSPRSTTKAGVLLSSSKFRSIVLTSKGVHQNIQETPNREINASSMRNSDMKSWQSNHAGMDATNDELAMMKQVPHTPSHQPSAVMFQLGETPQRDQPLINHGSIMKRRKVVASIPNIAEDQIQFTSRIPENMLSEDCTKILAAAKEAEAALIQHIESREAKKMELGQSPLDDDDDDFDQEAALLEKSSAAMLACCATILDRYRELVKASPNHG